MPSSFFKSTGFFSGGMFNLSPSEAFFEVGEGAVLVDVREPDFLIFKCFDVPRQLFIPGSQLEIRFGELPDDIPLIIADSVGLRSREAMLLLMDRGYKNVANLAGGIMDWERDGFPIVKNPDQQMEGSCLCQLRPSGRKRKRPV